MKLSITILASLILNGCINIPIPPSGNSQGKLGSIQIRYLPPIISPQNKSQVYAWEEFSKTLKDK